MSIRQLRGPVYLVEDTHYTATNSLVYIGPSAVTVIGASWTPETAALLAQQIRRITRHPIRDVIDTSPDPEWSGGNAYWKSMGVRIVAIRVTADQLGRTWNTTVAQARRNQPGYPDLPLVRPTVVYAHDFQLQDGDLQGLYLGPSHTPGDIFVYFPREQILDAGSILKEHLGNLANADLSEYPRTIERLKALHLDIRTVISGHWSAVHGPQLIDDYLQMLEQHGAGAPRR